MSCRKPVPLYLRRRLGALLFPATRVSGDTARTIYARPYRARVPHRKVMCSALHRVLRATGGDDRLLARTADPKGLQTNRIPGTVEDSRSAITTMRAGGTVLLP